MSNPKELRTKYVRSSAKKVWLPLDFDFSDIDPEGFEFEGKDHPCLIFRSFTFDEINEVQRMQGDFLEAQETRQAIADTEAADSDVAEASGAEMDLLAEMVNRAGVGLKGFRGDFNLYQGDVPPVVERGKGGAWLMANLASEDLWEVITAAMSSRVSDEDEGN